MKFFFVNVSANNAVGIFEVNVFLGGAGVGSPH
jgi:hypothetical protein